MLSIDYIRENKEKVKTSAKNKGREIDIEKTIKLDDNRKSLIQKIQKLRELRNTNPNKDITNEIKETGKKIKEELKKLESELKITEELEKTPGAQRQRMQFRQSQHISLN